MKKINSNWLLISLTFIIVLFNACSKDEDKVTLPVFPSKQTVNIKANNTKEFSFDANMDWKLTSSQTWCKFVVNEAEEYSLSGKAGNQTVTIMVTNENMSFDETKAILKLQMGNQSEDIADIIRASMDYELTVFDAEGNEVNVIEVGYKEYINFSVQANFDFAASEKPDWVEFDGESIVGSANVKIESGAQIKRDGGNEKYPVEASEANVINFANEAGTASFKIPVSFAGMDAEEIDIEENTPWHWMVSMDGKSFAQYNDLEPDRAPEYENAVPFIITALNDEYKFIYAEIANDQYWLADENGEDVTWLKVIDKEGKGKVSVEVDEFIPSMWGPKNRTGTILAFPAAIFDSVVEELEDGTDYTEFADKYTENILIEITQKEADSGIKVLQSGWMDVEVRKEMDANILSYLKNELFIEDVYAMDGEEGAYFTLYPGLENFGEEDGEALGAFYALTVDGEDVENSKLGLAFEGVDENGLFYLSLNTPTPFDKPFIVVFIDSSWMNKKALVVHPQ